MYMEDHPGYQLDTVNEVMPCLKFIKEAMQRDEGTLVVCTAGMSRSATICIAYLLQSFNYTYE